MNSKKIEYREIGINKKLRQDYKNLKTAQLNRAIEKLRFAMGNPVNIYCYELNRVYK